jgi:DNA-binding MarR family transcriptional regulator
MSSADGSTEQVGEFRLVDDVATLLLALAQRVQQHATARAAELGLTLSQAKVLMELRPGESVSMRALAVRLACDASNLTGLVDRLEERGALERRGSPNDRRIKSLVLTEDGVRLRADFQHRLHDYAGTFGQLDISQLQNLRLLLRLALDQG